MGFVIGMDEAGYGPNLGPLVVSATVWEVPGVPRQTDFWDAFSGVVVQHAPRSLTEIQIADSKVVHDPVKGVGALERGVMAAWGLLQTLPASLMTWWPAIARYQLQSAQDDLAHNEPWFCDADLELPRATQAELLQELTRHWRARCETRQIQLRAIRSDIVLTRRFNRLAADHASKGVALSQISMQLLQEVLPLTRGEPTQVWCDKHGGRNRYDGLLADIAGDQFITRLEEGAERSRYRIGKLEVCFQTRAEQHLPVALASMVCKYWRETTMELFNQYWQRHLPQLKPTKGYPNDARRFRSEVSQLLVPLGIEERDFWRLR